MLAYHADVIIATFIILTFGWMIWSKPLYNLSVGFDEMSYLISLLYESTNDYVSIHSFGDTFEPRTFSAQNHSTSELLRTL